MVVIFLDKIIKWRYMFTNISLYSVKSTVTCPKISLTNMSVHIDCVFAVFLVDK